MQTWEKRFQWKAIEFPKQMAATASGIPDTVHYSEAFTFKH
jgi:hypothetical protein